MRALQRCLLIALILLLGVPVLPALEVPIVQAAGASFYASPGSGSYSVGDVVKVGIFLNSGGQGINAVSGSVTWTGLQYSSVSTSGTIITNWVSGGGSGPVASSSSVFFEGGLPGSGYNGTAGRIVTITFTATAPGTATVKVNGSQALVGDGTGSNAYCCSSGATFTINKRKPPAPVLQIESKTHPNSSRWYNNRHVELNWYAATVNNGYRWSFDRSPASEPSGNLTGVVSTSYDASADGTWYFHLNTSNESGSITQHFQVNIDTEPPGEFQVRVDNDGNASSPTPKAFFEATDGAAGMERYEATIDNGVAFAISNGDLLPKQRPGEHSLVVRAVDKAGNVRESKVSYKIDGIDPPKILTWDKWVVIQQPVRFVGQSEPGDTIIVFLDDKEVDKFTAKDKQVPTGRPGLPNDGGGFKEGITWEYEYKNNLFPGQYTFKFARTNAAGAESSLTTVYPLEVRSMVVTLFGRPFNPMTIIKILIAIMLLLMTFIGYLLARLKWGKLAAEDDEAAGPVKRLRHLPRSFIVLVTGKTRGREVAKPTKE